MLQPWTQVSAGADAAEADSAALRGAVAGGHGAVVQMLLEAGANAGVHSAHCAVHMRCIRPRSRAYAPPQACARNLWLSLGACHFMHPGHAGAAHQAPIRTAVLSDR